MMTDAYDIDAHDIERLDAWVRLQPGAIYGKGRWHLIKISAQPGWDDEYGAHDRTDQALCSCEWYGPARTGDSSYSEAKEDGERHMWAVRHP